MEMDLRLGSIDTAGERRHSAQVASSLTVSRRLDDDVNRLLLGSTTEDVSVPLSGVGCLSSSWFILATKFLSLSIHVMQMGGDCYR